jgi:anti-sigma regulatory factor (Ser/Thr protein kinase)
VATPIIVRGLLGPGLDRSLSRTWSTDLAPEAAAKRHTARPSLGLEVVPEASHLPSARERLRDYLHRHCPDARLVSDVVLCLEEACTNVIRHSGAREAMQIVLHFDDDALVCRVRDRGRGFDTESFDPDAVPDPLSSQGRGLLIISRIMDELRLRSDGGLEVEMVKRAVPRREEPRREEQRDVDPRRAEPRRSASPDGATPAEAGG